MVHKEDYRYLGDIWFTFEIHLQVAAEHDHSVHQPSLKDGVV
jgi:hypothetical protein